MAAGDFVPVAALLVESHPTALAFLSTVFDAHVDHVAGSKSRSGKLPGVAPFPNYAPLGESSVLGRRGPQLLQQQVFAQLDLIFGPCRMGDGFR